MTPPNETPTLAPAAVDVERRSDGSLVLRSPQELGPYAAQLGIHLRAWADRAGSRTFLAERAAGARGWREVTYASARRGVDALSARLLELGLGPARPLAILSDNSVDHGLLALAAMQVGVPVAPISPAYSLLTADRTRLRGMLELLEPGAVFAENGELFATAIADAAPADAARLWSTSPLPSSGAAPSFCVRELLESESGPAVETAFAAVGPDSVAKILFTSGSTGLPKGVINTQAMLCSSVQAQAQVWPFLAERPPVIVDWLPWSHTFGGNHNFDMVLRNGGSLYVDAGKPAPGRLQPTLDNLADVAPTHYFNVPRGYAMLIGEFERDEALAANFFSRLEMVFYAAAALPQDLWERMEALALKHAGHRVFMASAWGSTETSPLATAVHFPIPRAGVIGLPVPGTEIAMVPSGSKLELRVKGPNVTPGYWKRPDLTREAFDEDGFYRIGDAGVLADPERPELGIVFDGRVVEDFKLSSGTWVNVGILRPTFLASCEGLVSDAVLCGHDTDGIGALVWPDPGVVERLTADLPAGTGLAERCADPRVRGALGQALARHNEAHCGNALRIEAALFLEAPPSIDAGEITDKGYVNQRAVLEGRAEKVAQLLARGDGVVMAE
ncbi:feruloyl-CoA synthase [Engelhardtia mirabilis]|uniref:Long-chain-fatty-acid--CoA ligase FadD15 n=1 Tax=Engelhardtia mirabilis TaxID=2528011 RepID=A0A518BSI4_9BACT|nr:Long-chain-fatty-acid--CoA ligase FadD15 [Planctomycetes bacterium Pla133]QDV04253.1 Long-chain-fatty-acid--CoA ligase FadD15 [Planctomycetes bacterium Pla86]